MESICTSFCLISFFEIYPCCCEYHQIIPFYRCGVFPCMYHITVCLSIQLSMDVWVVSRFQPLQINMLWIVAYKSKDICFHSLGEITRSGMAGFGVTYVLNFFKKLLNCFPKSLSPLCDMPEFQSLCGWDTGYHGLETLSRN